MSGRPCVQHDAVLRWLRDRLPASEARLDDAGGGRPEGVVVRTSNRSSIVKIRYEDYERAAKHFGQDAVGRERP